MQKQKKNQKSPLSIILYLALFSAICAAVFLMCHFARRTSFSGNNPQKNDGRMKEDLARLSSETYESIFLSMHSTESFREEDFLVFRGLDTVVAAHKLLNTKELSQYLDCILESGNAISHIYLGLDPELLWMEAREKTEKWDHNLSTGLYSYIEAHPDITFEVLLPYPYINYWLALTEEDLETLLTAYQALISGLSAYPNTKTFFPGFEEWLMINPGNYTDTLFDVNEIIAQKLFLYTFCDAAYQITPINESFFWDSLHGTVEREKNTPTYYPDLSGWRLVFFGDSVLANYPGSFSIPGYLSGLSGAETYNYAIGGTCAAAREESGLDFPNIIDGFLAEHALPGKDGCVFHPGDSDRLDGSGSPGAPDQGQDSAAAVENKKLCFLINYGFNDYFTGVPIENPLVPYDTASYKGGLRTCVSKLQEAFPDADYIIMSPTRTGEFRNGMDITSEMGGILSAYVEAAKEVAQEMGLFYIDNYNDFVVTEDTMDTYLADGTHPNERGRLAIAARIMYFIDSEMNP